MGIQTTKNEMSHVIEGRQNLLNRNVNILSKKSPSYYNENCPKYGLDICFCKCS